MWTFDLELFFFSSNDLDDLSAVSSSFRFHGKLLVDVWRTSGAWTAERGLAVTSEIWIVFYGTTAFGAVGLFPASGSRDEKYYHFFHYYTTTNTAIWYIGSYCKLHVLQYCSLYLFWILKKKRYVDYLKHYLKVLRSGIHCETAMILRDCAQEAFRHSFAETFAEIKKIGSDRTTGGHKYLWLLCWDSPF